MPRIGDEFLQGTIYLYESEQDAHAGSHRGGSGFMVSRPSKLDGFLHSYFVTCHHIITMGFVIPRAVALNGGPRVWPLNGNHWIAHPSGDDLAVAPVDLDHGDDMFRAVQNDLFMVVDDEGGPIVGDDLFIVSRLIGYDGKETNEPILRFGTLAKTSTTEIGQEKRAFTQESYLADMRSVSGHSGSAVFWLGGQRAGPWRDAKLLGIDWGHLRGERLEVQDDDNQVLGHGFQDSGIAAIVPAWKLAELLESDELVSQRRTAELQERRRREASPPAVED